MKTINYKYNLGNSFCQVNILGSNFHLKIDRPAVRFRNDMIYFEQIFRNLRIVSNEPTNITAKINLSNSTIQKISKKYQHFYK